MARRSMDRTVAAVPWTVRWSARVSLIARKLTMAPAELATGRIETSRIEPKGIVACAVRARAHGDRRSPFSS